MKKLVALLLTMSIVLSLCATCVAETEIVDFLASCKVDEFVLRNNIVFGDSMSTVKEKESVESVSIAGKDKNNKGLDFFWTQEKTVAGFDKTKIGFLFEPTEDKLVEMTYRFDTTKSKDTCSSKYETLYDGLVRKYGEPLPIEKGKTFNIITDAFYDAYYMVSIFTAFGKVGDLYKYNEWIVNVNDEYYVKIDLISSYWGGSYSDIDYGTWIGYKMFTIDDYNAVLGEKQTKQDIVDNDL